ncbi:MAG: hypothetical protein ACRDL8_07320, partial [Solirubrobacteraceae bacterium]
MRLARERGVDGFDEVGRQLGQRAHDLGAAASEDVGVSLTEQADEPRAYGTGDVGVTPGVADEHDLVTSEAGGGDPRPKLEGLRVPWAPTVDRREPLEQPVP